MLELAFVMAQRQNLFFVEIVEALRHELTQLEIQSTLSTDGFPAPTPERVYVVVPPHEYIALGGELPAQELLDRTIFVCGEQPRSSHFEENIELAPLAGAVFDFSRWSIREFAGRGISVEHFQLGYSPLWDHYDRERERDIDVLFMGCHSDRRGEYLAGYADSLWRWRSQITLTDNSAPNWAPSARFLSGEEKWDALRRARVLLNIHQGAAPYFEWQRIVQTIANGCVVVSEHSADYQPLEPGHHFFAGRPENLMLLAQSLLEDEPRRQFHRDQAYRFLREELPFRRTAERVVDVATELARRPLSAIGAPPPSPRSLPAPTEPTFEPPSVTADESVSALRSGLKDVRLDLIELRRQLEGLMREMRGSPATPSVEVDTVSDAYVAAKPRVSVLTTVYNYADHIEGALHSLTTSRYRDFEVIVVDDASQDASLSRVRAWMRRTPRVASVLLRHPTNRGLPHARNTALGFARGELIFNLDADNRLYPHGLERLVAALDRHRDAAFAYGLLQRFTSAGPADLMNLWPWEPERLQAFNYIDAMALMRGSVLRRVGGYTTDRRMHGWEDYDLWCHLAELGESGVLVPEVVARYRSARHSMLSVTNLSGTMAYSVLAERYPSVMGSVRPPL
jgi:Glycosyl transferase family 2